MLTHLANSKCFNLKELKSTFYKVHINPEHSNYIKEIKNIVQAYVSQFINIFQFYKWFSVCWQPLSG